MSRTPLDQTANQSIGEQVGAGEGYLGSSMVAQLGSVPQPREQQEPAAGYGGERDQEP